MNGEHIEDLVALQLKSSGHARELDALVEAIRTQAQVRVDSTDVKFAVFSLVRKGQADFDEHWNVAPAA